MDHSQLTIVSVYGHTNGSSAIPSLLKSLEELPGSRALLISIDKPADLPTNIEWKKIYPFNYKRYSIFIMHSLYAFIETDYCLIVQDDGWVLNGKNFKPEFYDYDFIGCPSHCGLVFNDKLEIQHLYLQFLWVNQTEHTNVQVIQNVGFSLRSKRFLEACNKHGLAHWGVDVLNINQSDGSTKTWSGIWNEDVHLTGIFRARLEAVGYAFAPIALAKYFGVEYYSSWMHDGSAEETLDNVLGMHGPTRKLLYDNVVTIKKHAAINASGEKDVINWMAQHGYKINLID